MTQAQLIAKYGDPSVHRSSPDPAWVKANIVYCGGGGKAPLPAMPGVPPRFWFAVHRLVEPMMRAAFAAAELAVRVESERTGGPLYTIERAGCFVFRHQRHDPSRPLSEHSWGTAVDIDADENSARQFSGAGPEPWSAEWVEIWPNGLPRAFVEAFEAHGFEWGGRWRGFRDPMHFQAR